MTVRRLAALIGTTVLLAGCGGSDPNPTSQACERWNELLVTQPPPSDAAVAAELRGIDLDGVDDDVAGAVVAVASRLESGDDVSASYDRLSDLCA